MLSRARLVQITVFAVLLFASSLFVWLARRPPAISEVQPLAAVPGEEIVVSGRNFGTDGRLVIEQFRIPPAAIHSWDERELRFRLPEQVRSGLLRVQTEAGESNAIFIINNHDLPQGGAVRRPDVRSMNETDLVPGDVISIFGDGFGTRRQESEVTFRHDSSNTTTVLSADSFWIVHWSDRQIRIAVPPDLPQGSTTLLINDHPIPIPLDSLGSTGTATLGSPEIHRLNHRITLLGDHEERVISVFALPSTTLQKPLARVYSDDSLVRWSNSRVPEVWLNTLPASAGRGDRDEHGSWDITIEDEVERRSIRWELPNRPPASALNDPDFVAAFSRYLTSDDGVPVTHPRVIELRQQNVNMRNSLPQMLRQIHQIVINTLEPDPDGTSSLINALTGEAAKAEVYADLSAALLRNTGIPARRNHGILILDDDTSVDHSWVEAFLPTVGWVPIDPALGDGMHRERTERMTTFYGDNRINSTIGALDSRRVVFHLDGSAIPRIFPQGTMLVSSRWGGRTHLRAEVPRNSAPLENEAVLWHEPEIIN